jgi:DNA-binding CsgD family transcriptional regulator
MIPRDDSELLLAMGRAAQDNAVWPHVLAALRDQMQATRAVLFAETCTWCCTQPPPALPPCFAALRSGRVYSGEELVDRAGPFDPDFSQGDARVIGDRSANLWLWLHRQRGMFRAADSARLSALWPHMVHSVVMGREHAATLAQLAMAEATLWRAGLAGIDPNSPTPGPVAARLLAEQNVAPSTMALRPGGLTVVKGMSAYCLPDGKLAILRAARDLPQPDQLAHALGLTLAEARLARTLGQGHSLPEATARLGLTRETGRSYAKQIYAKTGVSGQPGLMRLLWRSALAFG